MALSVEMGRRFEIIANFGQTVDISVYTNVDYLDVDENVDIHTELPSAGLLCGNHAPTGAAG
jgi:ribosomal protein L1